jgi:hypothetical protein
MAKSIFRETASEHAALRLPFDPRKKYSRTGAAREVDLSTRTIDRARAKGLITGFLVGGNSRRFTGDELNVGLCGLNPEDNTA